jgi:DNA-binding MarR family transcriptional regulator
LGNRLEDTLSYLLRNFGMKYRHYVYNVLGKDRWGVSQDLAIYHIAQNKKLNQKDLANKLNITPASVSVIVHQMESEGLLIRIPDKKDGRQFNLSLTEKGQSSVLEVKNSWSKIQEEITDGFDESEKATLLRLLQKVEKNLDELTRQNS